MAQATLNPAIEGLDKTSALYDLYTRFYDGITSANSTDAPEFVTDPIYKKNADGTDVLDDDGAKMVDTDAMAQQMAEYSTILVKNSAYMMANAIMSTIDPNGGSGGTAGSGYVSRNGDTMQGQFGALYGFQAGYGDIAIFETTIDADGNSVAAVTGNLQVSGEATIGNKLNLANTGIYFGGSQSIWYDNGALNLASQSINLDGAVAVDGSVKVGGVSINKNGISIEGYDYYHSGNCNKSDVDWTMKDANVNGKLYVQGEADFDGKLIALHGFSLGANDMALIYSERKVVSSDQGETAVPYITLNSDLSLVNNHGIKFDDNYIVWVRQADGIVSLSAPGLVLNLGDKGENEDGTDRPTQYIALQSDIKSYDGSYAMVTHDGVGCFPNGFSAGAANALGATFQTYYTSSDNYGVVAKDYLRFKSTTGPSLSSDGESLVVAISSNSVDNYVIFGNGVSDSIIYNPTGNQSITALCLTTDATHFLFKAPVEATKFAVKSAKYKTRLEEDVLFFDDNAFIEGVTNGVRLSKDAMFDGNLYSFDASKSSTSFSSGFAGSGWAILEDATAGGIHATFDSLTIRKKMRVYELEAQRTSVTNGSLWVSDSCSGDEVRELS